MIEISRVPQSECRVAPPDRAVVASAEAPLPSVPNYHYEALKARAAGLWSAWRRPIGEGFGILTYHRVAPVPKPYGRAPLNVTPQRLEMQLGGLLRRGYEPWPLQRLLRHHESGLPIPRNIFAVVFDDGYGCLAEYALPVLAELGVPATVLLATAYLDSTEPFPFDPWSAAGHEATRAAWRALTLREAEQMLESGWIELGAHTHTHQAFCGRTEALCEDIQKSVDVLRRRFGIVRPSFSLPFGICEPHWPSLLPGTGVRCCMTTACQLVTPADDIYNWGRFGAEQFDSPLTLSAKLDGWFSYGQRIWRKLRGRAQPAEDAVRSDSYVRTASCGAMATQRASRGTPS